MLLKHTPNFYYLRPLADVVQIIREFTRVVDSSLFDDETTEQVLKDLDSIKLKLLKYRKTE